MSRLLDFPGNDPDEVQREFLSSGNAIPGCSQRLYQTSRDRRTSWKVSYTCIGDKKMTYLVFIPDELSSGTKKRGF